MGIKGIKGVYRNRKTTCTEGENTQAYSRVLTNLNDCFVTIKTTPGLLSIKALEVLQPRSLVDYE